jgi:hypothetical protein
MTQKVPSFYELLSRARHSASHLEMRDSYGVGDEAEDFANWLATGERDTDPAGEYWKPWVDAISPKVAQGVRMRRARIVSEPVSDYIKYEHAATSVNVFAGEDVRWLRRASAAGIALPANDFWLFDGTTALVNYFDGNGDWASPRQEVFTDTAIVSLCATAFEAVWERGTPHDKYSV